MKTKKTLLKRSGTPQRNSIDWWHFSTSLFSIVCADYLTLRLLCYLEPLTMARPILAKMIEITEKSLKLFINTHEQLDIITSEFANEYGHDIEKLRKDSSHHNKVFDDDDIKEYSKYLCDKRGILYQYLRYGSESTTDGMDANISNLLPIIDKIFFKSLLLLPEGYRRVLNFNSPIKHLLTNHRFDQTKHKDLLIDAVSVNNNYIAEYKNYCELLDKEYHESISKKN